jgi:hypothetical protein
LNENPEFTQKLQKACDDKLSGKSGEEIVQNNQKDLESSITEPLRGIILSEKESSTKPTEYSSSRSPEKDERSMG